jgi:hypothetical protein
MNENLILSEKEVGLASYVFTQAEYEQLEKFAYYMTLAAKKKITLPWVANKLAVPMSRLQVWRRTPEYLELLSNNAKVKALERLGQAVSAQGSLAREGKKHKGSTGAFAALAKVGMPKQPTGNHSRKKRDEEPPPPQVNIETLILNVAKERIGIPVNAEVIDATESGADKEGGS